MIGLNIWRATGDFFTKIAFAPYNYFREINNSEHWWTSNLFNVFLFLVIAVLFIYWFGQLLKFSKNNTEDYN